MFEIIELSTFHANLVTSAEDSPLARGFRLGMPHLDAHGLSGNWLLRQCCHAHWWSIAEEIGTSPSEMRDVTGARIMASVVAASVLGPLHGFDEDDTAFLTAKVLPRTENGWRSEWTLSSEGGASIDVELVTAFAKRAGASNTELTAAEMPSHLRPTYGTLYTSRASLIRGKGKALLKAHRSEADAPLASCEVTRHQQFNGVGLMYFANFFDAFEKVEITAMPEAEDRFLLSERTVHYFGNIDAGDWLDLYSETFAAGISPNPEIRLISAARRRSDGRIIAVCTSRRIG